jgi:hypothetical protein
MLLMLIHKYIHKVHPIFFVLSFLMTVFGGIEHMRISWKKMTEDE